MMEKPALAYTARALSTDKVSAAHTRTIIQLIGTMNSVDKNTVFFECDKNEKSAIFFINEYSRAFRERGTRQDREANPNPVPAQNAISLANNYHQYPVNRVRNNDMLNRNIYDANFSRNLNIASLLCGAGAAMGTMLHFMVDSSKYIKIPAGAMAIVAAFSALVTKLGETQIAKNKEIIEKIGNIIKAEKEGGELLDKLRSKLNENKTANSIRFTNIVGRQRHLSAPDKTQLNALMDMLPGSTKSSIDFLVSEQGVGHSTTDVVYAHVKDRETTVNLSGTAISALYEIIEEI
ncbi:Uncharacterised protein [Serratia entomophila]|nr:hypothetical protein [Serratia entomophila]CAI0731484.1 Uncharacterised protein [Serratia entomophila]CAI0732564.1 Uncharacterised protein [Serratia entomophila]CAI0847876.1 Uncharacterised protein [Serratia entomophila]CAI1570780.1 Uncharacterised protein [Serratia entomophila]CAI1578214.1 Uncharacterised protein [Serratia entomophila]